MGSSQEASQAETSPPAYVPATMSLSLHYSRPGIRSEITAVGISTSTTAAFAIYAGAQTAQPWIDVFDIRTRRAHSKITGNHAVFGPQGNAVATLRDWTVQLASGVEYHHSSSVMLRDFSTGKTALDLREARGEPVVWSHDGKVIAASEGKCRMGVWDARTGTRLGRVVSHIDSVTHAAFTRDLRLVTLSRDGTLRVTDSRTNKTLNRLEIEGTSSNNPRALAVSPDGQRIISVWGTTVHIWAPAAGQLTSYNLTSTRQSEGWPLCISPDCRYMACWTEDGFDITDVSSGVIACERRGGALVTAGAFSADGGMLLLGRIDGALEVWDVGR